MGRRDISKWHNKSCLGGWCCGIPTYNPSLFLEVICKSKNMHILLTLTKAVTVKVVNPTL